MGGVHRKGRGYPPYNWKQTVDWKIYSQTFLKKIKFSKDIDEIMCYNQRENIQVMKVLNNFYQR